MDKKEMFNMGIAGLGTFLTWLLGGWDLALQILIIFIVLDYVTGLLKGAVKKELSSDVGFRGLARKAVILIVLIVAVSLDRLMNTGTWVFRTLVCYFYIANEGISIIENSASLGLPVPRKLTEVLVQLKKGNEEEIKEGE